eukprot:1057910-Prorocentrum_lima.AAC.1
MGFSNVHPWSSLPQRLGLAALGNSVAPPMAALCLRQMVGLWGIVHDPETCLAAPTAERHPAHA